MVVSFKVEKVGTRYRPKVLQVDNKDSENGTLIKSQHKENEGNIVEIEKNVAENLEVSLAINLFANGFSVGKPTKFFNTNVPKLWHPYDRASEKLFLAIECGCLPGDLFDDIHCKYIDGGLLCEIRDYRDCFSGKGDTSSRYNSPTIHRVLLRMGMENVVKDVSSLSSNSWAYEDALKFESQILKAFHPDLCLNPEPRLDRLSEDPVTKKLNLGIPWSWKKRKLSDPTATELPFSIPFLINYVPSFSLSQNSKSQFNSAFQVEPQLQLRSKLFQLEAENFSLQRLNSNTNFSMLNKDRSANLGGIPYLQAGKSSCNLKQQAATNQVTSLEVGQIGDKCHSVDLSSNHSNIEQLKLQCSLLSSAAFVSPISMQSSHIMNQHIGKNKKSRTVTQTRKASRRRNQHISTSRKSINEINKNTYQPSVIKDDSVLARFSEIKMVAQRYGLEHKKRKLNQFLGGRPFSFTSLLVGLHLLNSEDNENFKDATTYGKWHFDWSPDVSKRRTLTFVRLPRILIGNKIPYIVNEDQRKLVILEKLNGGTVEACVLYGHEEEIIDTIDFPFSPNFPNIFYGDLFATQYISLMAREGYRLSSDQIECIPHISPNGSTGNQQSSPSSSPIPAFGTIEQSAFKLSSGHLSKSQLNTAEEPSSIEQPKLQINNGSGFIQSQIIQRQRQQQLLQRRIMMGGFGMSGISSLGSNISNFNQSKQPASGLTDPLVAFLAREQRILMNEVSAYSNAVGLPSLDPSLQNYGSVSSSSGSGSSLDFSGVNKDCNMIKTGEGEQD